MKKIFKWVPIMLLLFLITGCVNFEYSMEIKEDKSVVVDVIYAMDKSAFEGLESDDEEDTESSVEISSSEINVEDYKKLEEKGWKVEKYTNKKDNKSLEGVKLSKTYPNIDNITKEKEKVVTLSDLFYEDKEFDETQFFSGKSNNYKASFVFEMDLKIKTTKEGTDEMTNDMSMMQNMFTLSYTVKLPVEAKSNNATTVSEDKKTLSWKLDASKKNEVNYEFALNAKASAFESKPLALYVVIGSIGLLLIFVIAALIKKGKTKNSQSISQEIPVQTPKVESTPVVEQPMEVPVPAPATEFVTTQVAGQPQIPTVEPTPVVEQPMEVPVPAPATEFVTTQVAGEPQIPTVEPSLVEEPIQVPVTEQPPENQNISN